MNKLLIGLLIVAVGAGAFLLLRKKKETIDTNSLNKEWVIGKWKTDARPGNDSSFSKFSYDFQKNGNIVRWLNDSTKADTSAYVWSKNNELVWKEKANDSTGKLYTVVRLTTDSLQIQSQDSVTILFTKQQ